MQLNEFLDKNEEQLDEGLKFFKESKKLTKYADKIEAKLLAKHRKSKLSADEYSMMKTLLKEIRKASDDFERLEKKYKVKDLSKQDAKLEHAKYKKKYGGMLKDIKSDKVKKLFVTLGISAAIAAGVTGVINPAFFANISKVTTASDFAPNYTMSY